MSGQHEFRPVCVSFGDQLRCVLAVDRTGGGVLEAPSRDTALMLAFLHCCRQLALR
jgi:hypothetical protein